MIRVLTVIFMLFSTLAADSSKEYAFVGLSTTTQTINLEETREQKTGFGIQYGKQSLNWRTTFTLEYFQNSYSAFSVALDKILLDDMFGTAKLRPYLGGVAGYMSLNDKAFDTTFDEQNGFYFGTNFGFIIYASDVIDVDISYHYFKVQNIEKLDAMHGGTLSVHYFF